MSNGRRSFRPLFLAAVGGLLIAVVLPVARASPHGVTLSLFPDAGPPTTRVAVGGAGFGPAEAVRITFDGKPVGKTRTDGAGGFTASLRIPRTAQPGGHRITARGRDSGLQASATFTVRTDWPMFRYSPERTGNNPYENTLSSANVAELVPKWVVPASELTNIDAAVVDGVVYTGDLAGHAFALHAATGGELWEVDIGFDFLDPTVVGGIVYTTTGLGATVVALDAATGETVWELPLAGAAQAPAVANGTVYVGTNGGVLYALDAATGGIRWQAAAIVESPAAVVDGTVYVGGTGGAGTEDLFAFDALTGSELWTADLAEVGRATPAVVSGVLYTAVGGVGPSEAYAIDAATGEILWTSLVSGHSTLTSSPAVADGLVYVNTFEGDALEAFDAATGELVWTEPVGGCSSSPAVANGVLYVGSDDFSVYALDALTGEVLWSYPTGGKACSGPTVVDGMVYMGSFDQNFYAFGLP